MSDEQKQHAIQVTHLVTETYIVTGAGAGYEANAILGAHMALVEHGLDGDARVEKKSETKTVKRISSATVVVDDDDLRAAGAPASA